MRVLFPLNGKLYYCQLATKKQKAVVEFIDTHGFATDATVSPAGGIVAYVRDQNLYAYDIAAKTEKALTSDGGGAIKNGMAEFIAQEEMDRSTGYWWAPDGRHIAFARVDESPIKVTERFEIAADNVATFAQRYPTTGGPNVLIKLGVIDIKTGAVTWMDLGAEQDIYLARVNWLPDGKTLAIQRESRNQRKLDLLFADIDSGKTRTVLTETSNTWIDLNDELTFLKKSHEFIWASARDGYTHLYLYGTDGHLIRQLTAGNWVVDDFRKRAVMGIDEKTRTVYFSATEKSPTERHLYRTSLDTADPRQVHRITQEAGVHGISMSPDARFYIDNFTSASQPPQVSLHAADGTLKSWLLENRLDAQHPDAPYLADNSIPEFGTLTAADGQTLYYQLFKPLHFDPAKRYPAIVDVYGGPGVQRVINNWHGNLFTQILTRAGYVVFTLDNRGSCISRHCVPKSDSRPDGRCRSRRPSAGCALAGIAELCGPKAHRRVGLELRRLHDAQFDVQGPRCLSRRRRRRSGHGFRAVRHALHGTLLGSPSGQRGRLRRKLRAALRKRSQRSAAGDARHGR